MPVSLHISLIHLVGNVLDRTVYAENLNSETMGIKLLLHPIVCSAAISNFKSSLDYVCVCVGTDAGGFFFVSFLLLHLGSNVSVSCCHFCLYIQI